MTQNSPNIKIFSSKMAWNWFFPLLLVTVISVLKFFPSIIEKYYSTGIYRNIGKTLRLISGWIGFSIGDLFYTFLVLGFIVWIIKVIKKILKKSWNRQAVVFGCMKAIQTLLWLFIWFHLLWGLNYNRTGIATQLQLNLTDTYEQKELDDLTCELIEKVNKLRRKISKDSSLPSLTVKEIRQKAIEAYAMAELKFDFLHYSQPSFKKPLYNKLGDYLGFTGYYNPFSGEAQVRTDIPIALQPYVLCHEIAHQLGYASESEANFAGYLACSQSSDLLFQYSVYLDLYKYAARELFLKDLFTTHKWDLDSLVRNDLLDIRKFFNERQNNISPAMNVLYNQYLKANQQTKGIESYNEVIGLLIAYKKKYGKI